LRIFKDNQTGNKSFRAEINQLRLTRNRRGKEPFIMTAFWGAMDNWRAGVSNARWVSLGAIRDIAPRKSSGGLTSSCGNYRRRCTGKDHPLATLPHCCPNKLTVEFEKADRSAWWQWCSKVGIKSMGKLFEKIA
jgi:hypothetical protein